MTHSRRTTILATVGVAAVMLVIGVAIGSIAFPTTKTETTLQLSAVAVSTSAITTVTTVSYVTPLSYIPNEVFFSNLSGVYFPNGYISQNVNVSNLKGGDNITLGQVRFQLTIFPSNFLTTEGNQVYAVTADPICPSAFNAYFPNGESLYIYFCPIAYPNARDNWDISVGTIPIIAVSRQSFSDEVEIAVGVIQ